MSIASFLRCLDGLQLAEAAEHDVMAQALNEHLLDHGDRFPIPYLRQRVVSERGPTAQRPLRWVAGHRAFDAGRRPEQR